NIVRLFTSILVSCVWGAAVLKLFRNKPYVTITNTYIRLDPQTKSEVTLYYDDIKFIDISEASFQKLIKIFVYDEKTLFKQLSLHNKIRLVTNALFGFNPCSIAYNSIHKQERQQLLATLDKIMAYNENQTSENLIINDINHEPGDSQQYYMERYGIEPPTALIIDKDYFKKAFGYSAFIFLIMFILFYVLFYFMNCYLSYIIVSFFIFLFYKVYIYC